MNLNIINTNKEKLELTINPPDQWLIGIHRFKAIVAFEEENENTDGYTTENWDGISFGFLIFSINFLWNYSDKENDNLILN